MMANTLRPYVNIIHANSEMETFDRVRLVQVLYSFS